MRTEFVCMAERMIPSVADGFNGRRVVGAIVWDGDFSNYPFPDGAYLFVWVGGFYGADLAAYRDRGWLERLESCHV